jgi:HlyD family secretion protein
MTVRGWIVVGFTSFGLIAAGTFAYTALDELRQKAVSIPTTRVIRGPLELKVYATGELRPSKSAMLVAPPVGGALQIVHLVQTGTYVNPGDVVVEFDPGEQQYNLEQNRSQLEEAVQEIKKMKADIAVRAAQDSVALLRARFDVRRAEIAIKGNDLLGAIEAKKNLLNLEEARRRLEQMDHDLQSRNLSNQADLTVLEAKRAKAMLAMNLAQQNIDSMTLRASIEGLVALSQNRDASGGIYFTGMELPDFREGDQTYPGRMIAQILDVSRMDIFSKITESDRGNLEAGQAIDVTVDALPARNFSGKIKSLAGMAASQFFDSSSTRTFDASFEMEVRDLKLNPGIGTRIAIRSKNLSDALSLPRQALFQKEGKPVVYLKRGGAWEAHMVQILFLTESRAVVAGLEERAEVALVNPELKQSSNAGSAGQSAPMPGGTVR